MIVVMKRGASNRDVEHVAALIREMGLSEHVSVGTDRILSEPRPSGSGHRSLTVTAP